MDPAQQTRPEMTLVAIPFVTKLKAVLSITFIAKCVAILMLVVYGLTYQGYFIDFPHIRPVPKTHSISLYGDYFKSEIVRKNASFVIIVLSAIEKYQRRDAIRETWWKDCQKHQKLVCMFMIDTLKQEENNTRIMAEINANRDIIISPINKGMLFGHRILYAMQWTVHHYNFDYLIRSDDDVLLCIEHMLHRYKFIPRRKFMSGILHCADHGMVYLDEGIATFSQDVVRTFLSQNPENMYCHTYGDQTYTTWIQDLKLDANNLYYIETKIHHHPPASRVNSLRSRTRICNNYIALHGVYGNDMKKFWGRRGTNSFPNGTGLVKLKELCPFPPTYDWRKFEGIYGFEPKLCNDPDIWTGVREVTFSRE